MPRLRQDASPFEEVIRVNDLTGGMDTQQHPANLPSQKAVTLVDWDLSSPGRLATRRGFVNFLGVDGATPAPPQGGVRVYLRNQDPFTLLAALGDLYQPSDGGALGPAIDTDFDPDAMINFAFDPLLVAAFDGVNPPQKSQDGATWTRLGKSQPAVPTTALIAGGSLIADATYEVAITWRESTTLHESAPSPVSTETPTGANLTIQVTRSPVPGSEGIDGWFVYARNVTAGESILRRVSNTPIPVGTVTFNVTSNTWFPNGVEAPFNNAPPGNFAFAVYWNGRWWAPDDERPNVLRPSVLFDGQSYPELFGVELPFEDGDIITALAPYGDTLLIFGTKSLGLLIGTTPEEFEFRLIPAGAATGAVGPRAVTIAEGAAWHGSYSGIYLFDGATDRDISLEISPSWREMITTSAAEDVERIAMVYDRIRHELRVSTPRIPILPAGVPNDGTGEWVLSTQRMRQQGNLPAWALTRRPTGGYVVWAGNETFPANRGRLLRFDHRAFAGGGRVWDENVGTSYMDVDASGDDVTGPVISGYAGPQFSTGFTFTRQLILWGEIFARSGVLDVQPFSGVRALGLQTLALGPENIAPYGDPIPYGTPTRLYGSGVGLQPFSITLPLNADGTTYSVQFVTRSTHALDLFSYAWGMVSEPAPRWIQ